VLSKIKLSPSLIGQSLYTCEQKYLTNDILESLNAILPTEIEIQSVLSYSGEQA
jgi:hypothetical protein